MCDAGLPLTDAQIGVGASVAVPFSLDGNQVHFEGTIPSMTSPSKVHVAFPGERSWLVARDRLFEVVALAARGKRRDHDATAAARGTTMGGDVGDGTAARQADGRTRDGDVERRRNRLTDRATRASRNTDALGRAIRANSSPSKEDSD